MPVSLSVSTNHRSKYQVGEMFRQDDLSQFFLGNSGPLKRQTEQRTQYFRDVQYKDNREIIVVKIIICYLNPFTTTTKFFISILK
jgi:hypothetical protein